MEKHKRAVGLGVIENSILMLRGQKIMLDRTVAELYDEEIRNLSQFVISPRVRHAPHVFAFTQEGVAMLSGILNSPRAVEVNIAIMRAFVKFRETLAGNKELALKLRDLEQRVGGHNETIRDIITAIREMMSPPIPKKPKGPIGFHP